MSLPSLLHSLGKGQVAVAEASKGSTSSSPSSLASPAPAPRKSMVIPPSLTRTVQVICASCAFNSKTTASSPDLTPVPVNGTVFSPARPCSKTPERSRLSRARSPPSESQLRNGSVADFKSALTRSTGFPAAPFPPNERNPESPVRSSGNGGTNARYWGGNGEVMVSCGILSARR